MNVLDTANPTPIKPISKASVPCLGLVAGEGHLPVHVAKDAISREIPVVVFSIGLNNRKELKQLTQGRLHKIVPGLVQQTLELMQKEGVSHLVFAGKVNKWILLSNPRFDSRAMALYQAHGRKNDDKVMQVIIEELAKEGITVLSQTEFMQDLFIGEGLLTSPNNPLTPMEQEDVLYGYEMAREMGRLDVGQTVVVHEGMILAVEAIEGTDECLKRAAKWARKKGGVVMKVAKPEQDNRFDVPTVGLRTLKVMKSQGLKVLATEAHQTLYLEQADMVTFANKHGIKILSYLPNKES
jgi:UDP-2,3-diacylglucosamine hydrolase